MRIINCTNCGTQNRVMDLSRIQAAVCGKCRAGLPEPPFLRLARLASKHKYWIILVTIVGGAAVMDQLAPTSKRPRSPTIKRPTAAWTHPPVAVSQGVQNQFTNSEAIAPFRILTPSGSESYYVKLVEVSSGLPAMTMFIYGGQSLSVEVPLGSYRVKYATGSTWYGEQHLFGPETRYSEADRTLTFSMQGQQIRGYTVELIQQRGGNLSTRSIAANQF